MKKLDKLMERTRKRFEQFAKVETNCDHKNAYYFHDNAPMYCPDCKEYIDGGKPIRFKNLL